VRKRRKIVRGREKKPLPEKGDGIQSPVEKPVMKKKRSHTIEKEKLAAGKGGIFLVHSRNAIGG